jgi:acetyl esterase/lipase
MLSAVFLTFTLSLFAIADTWQPPAGLTQIPLWPKDSKVLSYTVKKYEGPTGAKKPEVTDVTEPTYTVYSPTKSSGAAVLVFPGGGHVALAMDIEGTMVCDWLIKNNVTCVLVKYRVPYSGCYWDHKLKKHVTPEVPMALQDAQRAISLIRFHAKKYQINPKKIGVMGFSAGGNVAVLASTSFKQRSYESADEIDKISCRPDFAIPVFAGHMTMEHKNKIPKEVAAKELNPDIKISNEIPPTLLVHAKDDMVDPVYYSELYANELKKVGVDVQLNIYKTGGHAFGAKKQGKDSDRWMDDAITWLKEEKFI